jgi:hypothetical protein
MEKAVADDLLRKGREALAAGEWERARSSYEEARRFEDTAEVLDGLGLVEGDVTGSAPRRRVGLSIPVGLRPVPRRVERRAARGDGSEVSAVAVPGATLLMGLYRLRRD